MQNLQERRREGEGEKEETHQKGKMRKFEEGRSRSSKRSEET
jgi:hypothetical protein